MKLKRWEIVLKYIVEDYIETAEPVGSKNLLKNHRLNYSSATIRNEMAYLENLNYIEKTHTSSGRVPSINGYRYYVAKLRSEKIDKSIRYEIDRLVDYATSIEDLLHSSCEMLSNMTKLASCYLGPNVFDERLIKLESIRLTSNKFTFLFVTDKGYLENKTFVERENKIDRIIECSNKMNDDLNNVRLVTIFEKLSSIKEKYQEYKEEFDYIARLFVSMLKDFLIKRNSQFYGKDYLLDQPEFKDDIVSTRTIVNLLSHPYKLNRMFDSTDETVISIGDDNFKEFTIITKDINIPSTNQNMGKIAVVGPIRMDYEKVLQYLDYVTRMVAFHLSDLERKERNG